MTRSPAAGRRLAVWWLCAILPLSSCITTTTLARPSDAAALRRPPNALQVRFVGESAERSVIQYRTTPDSLFGKLEGSAAPGYALREVALPWDSVASVRVRRNDAVRAAAGPAVGGAMALMVLWILGGD